MVLSRMGCTSGTPAGKAGTRERIGMASWIISLASWKGVGCGACMGAAHSLAGEGKAGRGVSAGGEGT